MLSLSPRPAVVAHVCDDIACMTRGAEALCGELEKRLGPSGTAFSGGRAMWQRSACLGLCERAPAALVSVAGEEPRERVLAPATAEGIVSLLTQAVDDKLTDKPNSLNPKLSTPQPESPHIPYFPP